MKVIKTTGAPAAIGPYSQAIEVGGFLFTSGQIPLDPKGGEMPSDIAEQTRRVMNNLKAVLNEAGLDFSKVVKTTVFITDLADFGVVNEVYGSFFGDNPPARSCVQVAALPKGAKIEVELIAKK
ncbi:MAG: RidA family protein [Abditibacteriota bacterium]|nr:RidA family protein [Abditibacteriota bacterium]